MRREIARVGVEVDHHLAARGGERAPHRVALAEHRPELGDAARTPGEPPRRCARGDLCRAVLRRGVDDEDLVDQRRERLEPLDDRAPIVSATSRAGSTTVTGSRLRSSSSSQREIRVMEGPDQLTRTIAVREPAPTTYPWEAVLEPGRDEQLVATARERAQAGLAEPIPDDLHPAAAARG